jgi:hypothetical protein
MFIFWFMCVNLQFGDVISIDLDIFWRPNLIILL